MRWTSNLYEETFATPNRKDPMPLTILVVEDEETNMQIISLNLKGLGHRVVPATNPEEGIALARSWQPDIILMDLMFKGATFDGIEAIRRLKADPLTASIPIVAQTAAVLDFAERAVMLAGASGFLHKPFRRKQLVAAIESALQGPPFLSWRQVQLPRQAATSAVYHIAQVRE
jgi:CheY-like chemotaxis protein